MTIPRPECEEHLIWALLIQKCPEQILEFGISATWFTPDSARFWSWAMEHYTAHGSLPLPSTFTETWRVKPPDDLEAFSYYAVELRLWNQSVIIQQSMADVVAALRDDDIAIAVEIANGVPEKLNIDFSVITDTIMEGGLHAIYEERVKGGATRGLRTGFQVIDETVGGLKRGQLITLVGPPKAGKTFTLCGIAANLWKHDSDVMYMTFEMSRQQIRDRIVAILAEVNYTRLQNGTSTPEDLAQIADLDSSWEGKIILSSTDEATVPSVALKIFQHQPSAVLVDGVYFMNDTEGHARGSPQSLTNITRAFKRLTMKANIPIVLSTQILPSRYNPAKGITLDGIGYSSSFAQDSDLVLGVDTPDADYLERKRIAVVAARDAPIVETFIIWNWDDSTWEEEYDHVRPRHTEGSRPPSNVLDFHTEQRRITAERLRREEGPG